MSWNLGTLEERRDLIKAYRDFGRIITSEENNHKMNEIIKIFETSLKKLEEERVDFIGRQMNRIIKIGDDKYEMTCYVGNNESLKIRTTILTEKQVYDLYGDKINEIWIRK